MMHELKCWPGPFQEIWDQRKRFEVRKNDRNFKVGELLHLREWGPETKRYTGRYVVAMVTCLLQGEFGLPPDICVLGIGAPIGGTDPTP